MAPKATFVLSESPFWPKSPLSCFSIGAQRIMVSNGSLKTNDGYIAASLKIEQNLGACHHLSNCFDIISGDHQIQSWSTIDYI